MQARIAELFASMTVLDQEHAQPAAVPVTDGIPVRFELLLFAHPEEAMPVPKNGQCQEPQETLFGMPVRQMPALVGDDGVTLGGRQMPHQLARLDGMPRS
ncbi:hypothetical protein WL36_02095 [Burkholderia ubonensis]|nr:hypothetical protein WL36_02095 [Burkholderia ubonensis]